MPNSLATKIVQLKNAAALLTVLAAMCGCDTEMEIKIAPEAPANEAPNFDEEGDREKEREYEAAEQAKRESRYVAIEAHEGMTPFRPKSMSMINGDHCTVEFKLPATDGETPIGGFGYINGRLKLNAEDESISDLRLKILTRSMWTRPKSLITKLKSKDHLDVAEFPEIVFESTAFKAGEEKGRLTIEGQLTIKGVTKPVSIETQVGRSAAGITLTSDLTISLAEFGSSTTEASDGDANDTQVEVSFIIGKQSGPPLE